MYSSEEISQTLVLPMDEHIKRIDFYKKQSEQFKRKSEELRRALEMNKQIVNYYMNNNPNTGSISSAIKRKSLSFRESKRRAWCKDEARAAYETESAYLRGIKITIRFPDFEIDDAKIMQSDNKIESISFISSKAPRFCTAYIDPDANLEETLKKINETPFGNGYLRADLPLTQNYTVDELNDLFRINPRVLYVGNIPINPKVTSQVIKNLFLNTKKVDISTHKKSPYKFLHAQYKTVNDAIGDFHRLVNKVIENQSLDVHFFRIKNNIEPVINNISNNDNNHHNNRSINNKTVLEHDPETGVSSSSCFYNEEGIIQNNRFLEEEESLHSSSSLVTTSTFGLPQNPNFNVKYLTFDDKSFIADDNIENNIDMFDNNFELDDYQSNVKLESKPLAICEPPVPDDNDYDDDGADIDESDRQNNLMFIPYNEDDDESDFSS